VVRGGRRGGGGMVGGGNGEGGMNGEVRERLFESTFPLYSFHRSYCVFGLTCEERRRCLVSKRRVAGSWGLCECLSGDQSF